jgi:hypothetical protein
MMSFGFILFIFIVSFLSGGVTVISIPFVSILGKINTRCEPSSLYIIYFFSSMSLKNLANLNTTTTASIKCSQKVYKRKIHNDNKCPAPFLSTPTPNHANSLITKSKYLRSKI